MKNPDSVKQVIVVRKDLNMRKGKMVAQGAHASLAVMLSEAQRTDMGIDCLVIEMNDDMKRWINGPFTKICVGVDSEEELLAIHKQATDANICCSLIKDAGLTEFDGVPTYTTVGIGPAKSKEIDKITGKLKLL